MELRLLSHDDVLHLEVVARKVQPESPLRFAPLDELLGTRGYAQPVLLSMAEARFIDSSGLAWLVVCHKRFIEAGGKLVLHSVRPPILELLSMMRLELVLHLAEDASAALKLARDENP